MIDKASIKYAGRNAALTPTELIVKRAAFRQGAFWALDELLTALGQTWALKKRDQDYLETIKSLVSRIEGKESDGIVILEGPEEKKQAAPGNQRTKR